MAFLLLLSANIFAQNKMISGSVLDSANNPIAGASIKIVGTKIGTMTNSKGEFKLNVPGSGILEVSAIGYAIQKVAIEGRAQINIILKEVESNNLNEVVITAGGVLRKKVEIGTSQTVISGEQIVKGKSINIAGGLMDKVAGLQIQGTTGGVNPNYRIILRGDRSLTGNNQALLVLDNVIVPNEILSNLNPEDVESITTLQGSGAAAIYGTKASNGAIIITTKKGKVGRTSVRVAQTETFEHVAYFPKMQSEYGQGGSSYGYDENGYPLFSSIENQSYGPPFTGLKVPLGDPLEDGSQDSTYYSGNDTRKSFWDLGLTNQTDFSVSSGDAVSTLYISGQYVGVKGTTPKDKFNRTALRLNGTRKILPDNKLNAAYSFGFTENNYNTTTKTADIYNNMLNMPSNIEITKYANWQTDKFANPDGYYNPWYLNPYWEIDNYRQKIRNTYLVGNLSLTYAPLQWLSFTARQGITYENQYYKNWNGSFTYTEYAKDISGQSKSDIKAAVSDGNSTTQNLLSDLFFQIQTKKNDFSFNFLGGGQWDQDEYKGVSVSASNLSVPGLYNVGNLAGIPGVGESNYKARTMGIYGDFRIGYKELLFLHLTGRNDWTSILPPESRSFFYPSVDLSYIASNSFDFLKRSPINYLKLRGGWSKVGNVNLPGTFGAYQLQRTFSQQNGFPYGTLAGFGLDNTIVSQSLKPELTKQYEFGFDMNLFNDRITSSVTWYHSNTDNQTVNSGVSWAAGGGSYLTNVGETMSQGLETELHVTPIKNQNWEVTIGGNYTHLDNKVIDINGDAITQLSLATYSDGSGSYAVAGQAFPVILGFDYVRDPDGHVIVDRNTGLPTKDDNLKNLGNAVAKDRLGLDFNIRYKSFALSGLFEYRGGYKMYFGAGSSYDWAGTGIQTTIFNRGRFVFPNSVYEDPSNPGHYIKNTTITIPDGNGNAGFWTDDLNRTVTSNYVTSGDFWKLRELSLSYSLPQKLLDKTHFIKTATISLQGRNLFIWLPKTNLYTDPEYSEVSADSNGVGITGISSAPPSRYYGGTIAITF